MDARSRTREERDAGGRVAAQAYAVDGESGTPETQASDSARPRTVSAIGYDPSDPPPASATGEPARGVAATQRGTDPRPAAPRPGQRARAAQAPRGRGKAAFVQSGEPPLDSAGESTPIARRGVAWRWLVGSVLTGATGALLIGAAIIVAVEGTIAIVAPPERAIETNAARLDRGPGEAASKGDRLVRTSLTVTATNSFRAPMVHRVGERELVRAQTFTRLATGLSRIAGVHAAEIPRFDPMRYLGEGDATTAPELVELDPEDADVAFVRRSLADLPLGAVSPALSDGDALAQVLDERRMQLAAGRRPIPLPAQALLGRTVSNPADIGGLGAFAAIDEGPFDSIEVRVIPENVTTLPKRAPSEFESDVEERALALGRDQSLAALLAEQGVAADDIGSTLAVLGGETAVADLPAGQPVRVLLEPAARPGDPHRLLRLVLYGEYGVEAIVAVTDDHRFAAVAIPEEPDGEPQLVAADDAGVAGARLYESLFETVMKHGLDRETADELVQVFAYDVDFQRRVQPGDAIDVFYTSPEEEGPVEILSAALTIGGETRRVYRFHSPEDGSIDYFDAEGRSLKKFLMRKPIADGRLTSGFGMRRHPVLRYARMHTGVDWANRVGTPIFAAGAGTVTVAGWEGGYGRRVEIQHANGYLTTYSHMSRIGNGIEPGARVTQGQVIGLLGNSGLSTGPHLHYEVKVNGRFVDPLKIRVPRSRELDGRALADFTRERDQIDALMDRAGGPARLAQSATD